MKTFSKEMRKRQKHFPWLKTFLKEFFKTYPNCKKALQCLIENIEKEVKEVINGHKQKTEALFETVNDLFRHVWWKIHWKNSSQWTNYWNVDTSHHYHCSEISKCFGKLLNILIYLGIILSEGASDSLWIKRILQAINILPVNDEMVYDALLQLHSLKKKYKNSYMEILRHKLCSEIIWNISEPAVYLKSLMLLRRLRNYMKDEVTRASLISVASKIKPPSNLSSWLSSLEISVDVNKSFVDQLFKKNSKQVFQKLYHVLMDSNNTGLINKGNSKLKKKLESGIEKDEESLLRVAVGFTDTPNKNIIHIAPPVKNINIDGKSNQFKKVLRLPKLCKKIENSEKKKKHNARNVNADNTGRNIKSELQPKNTKTDKLIESALDSRNISTNPRKSKKKKKSKTKSAAATVTDKNNNTNSKETSKNKKSRRKSKKSKKKKKPKDIENTDIVIPNNKKRDSSNLESYSNEANASNDDSISVNSKFHTERSSRVLGDVNNSSLEDDLTIKKKKNSKDDEKIAIKKVKLVHSAAENSDDKTSNRNYLSYKLPNLLANYEIYSSAEENENAKRDVSSCPLVESDDNILVPDTCQNDVNSIVPFNLDSWVPSKNDTSQDTSVSNSGHQSSRPDYSSTSDSAFENRNYSEESRDTLFSNDKSQVSDKYPYVSLVDIRKNKKLLLYQNSDYSNSSFDDSVVGNASDSEVSQDTFISYDGSDKNLYVSLVDIRKMKNQKFCQKSDHSNSSFDSCCVNGSEMCRDTFVSHGESRISDKDASDFKKFDRITHHSDSSSNYDPILGKVSNTDDSNQNSDNSSENRNNVSQNAQDENHYGGKENKDSELPPSEALVQSNQFQENQSPSKAITPSLEQDVINTKINSPTKRKQTSRSKERKRQVKKKYSSDNNKDLKEENSKDLEAYAKDVNVDAYLNDLSTLLPNHGDTENQENGTISPSADLALNRCDTQDVSQFQELHEESNILPHDLIEKRSASHTYLANTEKQPCFALPNQNDARPCSIETVIGELIESALSQAHGSCINLNSVRLSDDGSCNNSNSVRLSDNGAGDVHGVSDSFQTRSNLVPSDCFRYESDLNTPQQNNNQSNIHSVPSTVENRSMESEVAQNLLNLNVSGNSQRTALSTNPDHRKENANVFNADFNSVNRSFVVDCNIINDFDSRNSSQAGSSASGDTTTIKVVLNLINTKPENSVNPHSSGKGFFAANNSSHVLHPSVTSGQLMNNPNSSLPTHSYFSEPPFFTRRPVTELVTPPDSERHLRIPSHPRGQNKVPSYSEDRMNLISSKLNGRSSTPKSSPRKRQPNSFSHSSESANEWGVRQFDLNSSFSNIPSLQSVHCRDVQSTLNVHQKGNNKNVSKGNQNKELISSGTARHSTSADEKTTVHSPRQIRYRNSRPSIYSDEGEDELSVSTMSLLSGEETTDHSFLKTADTKISPKYTLQRKNKSKKLFQEEKFALDSPIAKSTVGEKSAAVKKRNSQKRVVKNAKKPKTAIKGDYNLRSRSSLAQPTKLSLYFT